MTSPAEDRYMHSVAAICGSNPLFPPERMGCGQPISTCAEVFRCTDCAVPFHRACAMRHFEADKRAGAVIPTV